MFIFEHLIPNENYLALILFLLPIQYCKSPIKEPDLSKCCYIYTDHDANNKPLDSLKVLCGKGFKESLHLYANTDTLNKSVSMLVHMAVFELNKIKFAVITDTSATTFYKFSKGRYIKICGDDYAMAFQSAEIKYRDFNNDNYKDILYTIPSGGSHGDDNMLLLFDPVTKCLVYNDEYALCNASINPDNTITSNSRFQRSTYKVRGNKIIVTEKKDFLQGNDAGKVLVNLYGEEGNITKTDTIYEDK